MTQVDANEKANGALKVTAIMEAVTELGGQTPHGDIYIAFVPDEEIGLRGRESFEEHGGTHYARVPAIDENPPRSRAAWRPGCLPGSADSDVAGPAPSCPSSACQPASPFVRRYCWEPECLT